MFDYTALLAFDLIIGIQFYPKSENPIFLLFFASDHFSAH